MKSLDSRASKTTGLRDCRGTRYYPYNYTIISRGMFVRRQRNSGKQAKLLMALEFGAKFHRADMQESITAERGI